MKHFVCILVIALVHRAICFPVSDPVASVSPSVPALTPEVKGSVELKSDAPITPVVAGSEIVIPPAAPPAKEVIGEVASSPTPTPAAVPVVKEASPVIHDAPKPSSPVVADEPSVNHKETVVKSSNTEAVKNEVVTPTPDAPIERSEMTNNKVVGEQMAAVSSEQPKEANNQVNSVSVDEPKPVRNEVKSEIPQEEKVAVAPPAAAAMTDDHQIKVKDEVKPEKVGDAVKEEVKGGIVAADQVKSEKIADEVKSEKVEAVKNVMVGNAEMKHDEAVKPSSVSSEESVRKGDVSGSSEEKNASVERVVVSDEKRESGERNESAEDKRESSASSSEEVKGDMSASLKPAEKPIEEPKKEEKKEEKKPEEKKEEKKETVVVKDEKKELREESPVKPTVEAQVIESVKPSTVAIVAASTGGPQTLVDSAATEKVDVIKREAAKDNKHHEEKKNTEIVKKDKLKGGSSAQKDDESKSSKGQEKIVN